MQIKKIIMTDLKNNKGLILILASTIILSVLYISTVRILVGDNWIVYSFVRGIETYGLGKLQELSTHYRLYITYYPIFLWTISNLFNLNPITVDLVVFLILFPSIAILIYRVVNALLKDEKASSIAVFLFLFGGGSAWIARLLYTNDFWMASYLSLDSYFGDNWLVTGLWAYKGVNLLLALSSELLFAKIYLLENLPRYRKKSTFYYITLILCISLAILDYPYGILFVIGISLIVSFYAGLFRTKLRHKLQSKTLLSIFMVSLLAMLIVTGVDYTLGGLFKKFFEDRLNRFYGIDLNAYFMLFLILFGSLVLSIYLYNATSEIVFYVKHRKLLLNGKNNKRRLKWVVGILNYTVFGIVIFGIVLWLINPKPQEYLLTLTNWPFKYTIARYSFLFLLALFIATVAYNRGYLYTTLISILSVTLVIIAGTLIPLPVKTRTLLLPKLALVIAIGYGILRIIEPEKVRGKTTKSKKISHKITYVCLMALLISSIISSGYFWCNILQQKYPECEVELSNWISNNTPADLNLRFLSTPEWLTIKSIEWLAAKPNITPIGLNNASKTLDILSENVQKYGQVYLVIYKFSKVRQELDKALSPLKTSNFLTLVYENDAYQVYVTTTKLSILLKQAKNLSNPLDVINNTDVVFYESFDSYNSQGIYNNAIFINNSSLVIESNASFHGEFTISLWLKIESNGEILFIKFNSGYLRIRANNEQTMTLILYSEKIGKPEFISVRAEYNKWIHLVLQAYEDKLNLYENGTLISSFEDETIIHLANATIDNIRISDKLWWDIGFQGYIDEIIFINEALPYEDILMLYLSCRETSH